MPAELKDALERASLENGRSLTAEIVHRLTESLETDVAANDPTASFDAMKPILEAVNAEWSKRYETQMAAMRAVIGTIADLAKEGKATADDLARIQKVLEPRQEG